MTCEGLAGDIYVTLQLGPLDEEVDLKKVWKDVR